MKQDSLSEHNKVSTPLSSARGDGGEAAEAAEAVTLYQQGNAYRRQGQWHEAINCYIRAIELDPDSPAVEAKRMLDDIMNFYHKDAYNP